MKDKEIFDGFNITLVKKTKGHEPYSAAEEIVGKSVKNPTKNAEDVEKKGKHFMKMLRRQHMPFSGNLSIVLKRDWLQTPPKYNALSRNIMHLQIKSKKRPKKYTRQWLSFTKSIQNSENNWTHSIQNLLSSCLKG